MNAPFGKFHHVGIVVPELEPARTRLVDLLCGELVDSGEDELLAVEWCWIQSPESPIIELLAPIGEHGAIARYLRKRPSGFHHVSFATADVTSSADHVREVGLTVIGENRDHDGYEEIFADPHETGGALFHSFRWLNGSLDEFASGGES
jgi:methylmalonyl-CoA/ethylmalonyl-CoA epimerase